VDGFVAVTDPAWWEQLAREPGPKDANFWRPSTRAFRLGIGTPFFFKLKAPHNAIAGFGYFAGFSILPDWLAWETFGTANGVADLAALRARLSRIRDGARIEADPGGRIGCCLIAEATFFDPRAWIAAPTAFSPRTQTGAGIDLDAGDGRRVWMECFDRVNGKPVLGVAEPTARYGTPTLHTPRLGQAIFRVRVLDAYGRACAVTNEHSLPVLDAAHIRPYGRGGEHEVVNGLTMRTDLHRLFDRGYVTIDEERRLVVGRRLRDDFENGKTYYALHGRRLDVPKQAAHQPAADAIAWHRNEAFLG
jgi:putative restriction endonuclease